MKKAQVSGELFRKLLTAILIVIIVIFGLRGYRTIRGRQEDISAVMLMSDIIRMIEENIESGSITTERMNLPSHLDVCFLDLSKSEETLSSNQIQSFPQVKDALESGIEDNIYILKDGKIRDSAYAHICLDNYPYFVCTEFVARPIDLLLEGRGKCTAIFFDMTIIYGNNKKNPEKYPAQVVFFMPYEGTNWRAILRLVPVTMWNDNGFLKRYPYIAYDASSGTKFDNDKINNLLDREGLTKAIAFDSPDVIEGEDITKADFTDDYYLSFWETYQDIVLIDYDNRDSALTASLYAAELNAPLIFVNPGNINQYEGLITNKKIHIIDFVEDMPELNVANQRVDLSGDYLKSQVISEKFSKLRSQIDIED